MTTNKPLSLAFNAAVMTMARKVCPTGYDVTDMGDAPDCLEGLNSQIAYNGRILVSSEASDNTIFADAEHNYAFRAWHDWTHWIIQAPFTLEGERLVAMRQMEDIKRVFGPGKQTDLFCLLIEEEVIGQAQFYASTGSFPEDQRAFAEEYITAYSNAALYRQGLLRS